MKDPAKNQFPPMVIEQVAGGERAYDLYSRLLKDRIVFLHDPIDDMVAANVVAQLLFLAQEDSEKEIKLYISSPGGLVSYGLSIYDTIQSIKPDVSTICVGMAASMAAILLAAGTKGKRLALPHSLIMLHQPSGGVQGQASDIQLAADHIVKQKRILNEIIVKHTGQALEKVEKDTDRDFYLTAEEAKTYGIIDAIIPYRIATSKKNK